LYPYLTEIDVQQARTGPHVEDLIEIMPMRPAAGPGIAETLFPRSNKNSFRRAKPVLGKRIKWWRVG